MSGMRQGATADSSIELIHPTPGREVCVLTPDPSHGGESERYGDSYPSSLALTRQGARRREQPAGGSSVRTRHVRACPLVA